MEKGNSISNQRIAILVKAWIESEILIYRGQQLHIKKYFRYDHLGKKLIMKLQSIRNGTITIKSEHADNDIVIYKGKKDADAYTITVEKNELCLSKN